MKKLILLLLFLPILCFGQTNTIAPDGGNVVTKDADGNVTITGTLTTAKVIRELDFNAGAVRGGAESAASWVSIGMKGAWEFANNQDNEVVTAINFPKDMDLSTAPTIKVCWSSGATSADAVWQVEYLYRQTDEDVTAAAQETLNQTATSSSTANGFTTTEFIGFAIPNANDKTIFLRLTRLGSDVDDNLGNTAELHSIILKYTSDKLGKAL